MDDQTYIIVFVGGALLLLALLEWLAKKPPTWVWKSRKRWNEMKQSQLGLILILALVVLAIGCAILTGFVALTELKPWAGHIA